MLNFIKAERDTNEMIIAKNQAMAIIDLYPEIFPHLYKQGHLLEKYITKGNIILQDGVVITFSKYKNHRKMSKNATTYIKRGDFILHQIANIDQHNCNSKKVLNEFIEYCKSQYSENLFLTVRKHNDKAVQFYFKRGFVKDSDIIWTSKKDGIIPGIVFRLRLVADKNIETICI